MVKTFIRANSTCGRRGMECHELSIANKRSTDKRQDTKRSRHTVQPAETKSKAGFLTGEEPMGPVRRCSKSLGSTRVRAEGVRSITGRVGSGRVGSGRVALGGFPNITHRARSVRVRSGPVTRFSNLTGRVGSEGVKNITGLVRSGRVRSSPVRRFPNLTGAGSRPDPGSSRVRSAGVQNLGGRVAGRVGSRVGSGRGSGRVAGRVFSALASWQVP